MMRRETIYTQNNIEIYHSQNDLVYPSIIPLTPQKKYGCIVDCRFKSTGPICGLYKVLPSIERSHRNDLNNFLIFSSLQFTTDDQESPQNFLWSVGSGCRRVPNLNENWFNFKVLQLGQKSIKVQIDHKVFSWKSIANRTLVTSTTDNHYGPQMFIRTVCQSIGPF